MSERQPECPRCAYDLTGLVATWTESCPLTATCSECGLTFECARVFSVMLIGPAWSYEHRRSVRTWWATSRMAVNPWRLCRELGVDHEVRPWRLVRFIAWWLAALHLVAFMATYGLSSILFFGPGGSSYSIRSLGIAVQQEFLAALGRHLLFPYAGQMNLPTGAMSSVRIPLAPVFMLVYLPVILMPAWMLLLGTSLRTARVRKVHLLRGLAYSIPGAAGWLVFMILGIAGSVQLRGVMGISTGLLVSGITLLWPVYLMLWWFLFIRRYLRLRHAAAVVGLNMVMTVLTVMISFLVVQFLGGRF